jgi:hypothetical protein
MEQSFLRNCRDDSLQRGKWGLVGDGHSRGNEPKVARQQLTVRYFLTVHARLLQARPRRSSSSSSSSSRAIRARLLLAAQLEFMSLGSLAAVWLDQEDESLPLAQRNSSSTLNELLVQNVEETLSSDCNLS